MEEEIIKTFGNRLRLRACGILIEEDKVLLIKHHALGNREFLLCPPGGGLQFGEKLTKCLEREFLEETNLKIEVKNMLYISEYLESPLHAVELFFSVEKIDGILEKGMDPELSGEQIITDVRWYSFEELSSIENKNKHSCLHNIKNIKELTQPNFRVQY